MYHKGDIFMKRYPKISVLIPNYNSAKYLPEAIESVLNQSLDDFELIIVDNKSNDNSIEIVENYMKKDKRIQLYINDNNIGMYRNFNQALLYSKGEYIKFLNSDDKLHYKNLEILSNILDKKQSVSIVTSLRQCFGDKNDILYPPFNEGEYSGKEIILKSLKIGNWIGEPTTVMIRRKNLNLGLFDISLLMFADFDMWLRQLQVGNIYFVKQVLSYFRIHKNQGTQFLNEDEDKQLFNLLQLVEYNRYSLQVNRFGYEFLDNRNELKYVNEWWYLNTMSIFKNLFKNTKHKYRLRNYIYMNLFNYIKYLPKKFFTIYKKEK